MTQLSTNFTFKPYHKKTFYFFNIEKYIFIYIIRRKKTLFDRIKNKILCIYDNFILLILRHN